MRLRTKLGGILEKKCDYEEGLVVLKAVKECLERGDYSSDEYKKIYSDCVRNMAIIYYRQGKFDQSLICDEIAISIKKEIGERMREAWGFIWKQLRRGVVGLQ